MQLALWIVTILLAIAYLFAGVNKAFRPKPALANQMAWTEDFSAPQVKTIGTLELLGVIGLILPPLTGIATFLTPAAAFGLALVQVGAIPVHIRHGEARIVPFNVLLLLLAVFVGVFRIFYPR